jgi:hypothetical protein
MTDAVGQKLFDGINHPSAATVKADEFVGGLLYAGTPASSLGKDFTAAQYADYLANGLWVGLVFEAGANDIASGATGGAAHAQEFWNDCRAKGVSVDDAAFWACDEHVVAANLGMAVQYGTGFRNQLKALGWTGPVGVYGFSEVITYVHDNAPEDAYWGCGSRSVQPPYVNIWQDNTTTATVGGAADDVDRILISLPTAGAPPVVVAPPPVSPPLGGRLPAGTVLREGSNGGAVRVLQQALNTQYPLYSHLVVDGDFGPATLGVVREFQSRARLVVDGIAGPATLHALHLL